MKYDQLSQFNSHKIRKNGYRISVLCPSQLHLFTRPFSKHSKVPEREDVPTVLWFRSIVVSIYAKALISLVHSSILSLGPQMTAHLSLLVIKSYQPLWAKSKKHAALMASPTTAVETSEASRKPRSWSFVARKRSCLRYVSGSIHAMVFTNQQVFRRSAGLGGRVSSPNMLCTCSRTS